MPNNRIYLVIDEIRPKEWRTSSKTRAVKIKSKRENRKLYEKFIQH